MRWIRRRLGCIVTLGVIVVVGAIAALLAYRSVVSQDPLLTIVRSCAAGRTIVDVLPVRCISVDREHHVAIIRSVFGRYDYLLVPTIPISGIEDPQLRDASLPNYWALAWQAALKYLPARATANPANLGLAINSVEGRSDDQLHIHVSCIRPVVRQLLAANQSKIGTNWSAPFLDVRNETFRVRRIDGSSLDGADPFLLLLQEPGAASNMGLHTLVVTGATWDHGSRRGFYLLDDYAHDTSSTTDHGHGENLLDKSCRRTI